MKNIFKNFIFCIFGLTLCCSGASAKVDYISKAKTEFAKMSHAAVYISPQVAEYVFSKWLPFIDKEKIDPTKQIFESIAEKHSGFFTLEQLLAVCVFAYSEPENIIIDNGFYKLTSLCTSNFVNELIDAAKQTNIFDGGLISAYDGTKFNQACTPSVKSDGVSDIICSSGNYSFDPAFEKAMITKFRLEGGCAKVGDGNGVTCFGVAGSVNPEVNKCGFSRAHAEKIAYERYYKKHNINLLPDAIRGDVFMAIWGIGNPKKAIVWLQNILGVSETGKVDEATIDAAQKYKGNLRKQYLKQRFLHWEGLRSFSKFGNGWSKAMIAYIRNGCHAISDDYEIINEKQCPAVTRKSYNKKLGACINKKVAL